MRSRVFGAALVAALCGAGTAGAASVPAGDPAKGEAVFQERCTLCHQLDASAQGPALKGVVDRRAGAVPDFSYTDALKGSGLVWTPQALDAFLANPQAKVPGTAMAMAVPDPRERADLIAFLASQK